ncbi:hypothetical protein D9M71_594590 [compost metagenome]
MGVLGGSEAGAFEVVHYGHRHALELLAGGAGDFQVLALHLRVLFQEGLAVALHEGVVEGPEGQAEEGHPDQLLFQEELEVGRLAVEGLDQGRNVHPGLVVADHQVGRVLAQAFAAADVPVGRGEAGKDAFAVLRPGFGYPHHTTGAGILQVPAGQDELEQGDGQHRTDQDQGVQQEQRRGGDSGQQWPHGSSAPRPRGCAP